MRKARVDIHLGKDITKTQIAIDGVSVPCKQMRIDLDARDSYPMFTLLGDFHTLDPLYGPLVVLASPLVVHPEFPMNIEPDISIPKTADCGLKAL